MRVISCLIWILCIGLFFQACKPRSNSTSGLREFETSSNFCSDTLKAVAMRYNTNQGNPREVYAEFLARESRAIEICMQQGKQRKNNPFQQAAKNTTAHSGNDFGGKGCDVDTVQSMEELDQKISQMLINLRLASSQSCQFELSKFCKLAESSPTATLPTSCKGLIAAKVASDSVVDAYEAAKNTAVSAGNAVVDTAQTGVRKTTEAAAAGAEMAKEGAVRAGIYLSEKATQVKELFMKNNVDPVVFLSTTKVDKLCEMAQQLRKENISTHETLGLATIKLTCLTFSPEMAYEFIADSIDSTGRTMGEVSFQMGEFVKKRVIIEMENAKLAGAKVGKTLAWMGTQLKSYAELAASTVGWAWDSTKGAYFAKSVVLGEAINNTFQGENNFNSVDGKSKKNSDGSTYLSCCECKKQVYVDDSWMSDSYLETLRYRSVIQGGDFSTSNCNKPSGESQGYKFPDGTVNHKGKMRDKYYYYEGCEKIRVSGDSCMTGNRI